MSRLMMTGPKPLPKSSVRLNNAKMEPRVSGAFTFRSIAFTLGPVMLMINPVRKPAITGIIKSG